MILLTVLKSTGPKEKEHSSNALRFVTLERTEFTKKNPNQATYSFIAWTISEDHWHFSKFPFRMVCIWRNLLNIFKNII